MAGILRGGAQQLYMVLDTQTAIQDLDDVDVRAILASAFFYKTTNLVGLGPWGELSFPPYRECIVDLADGKCELTVRWNTDEVSSPVVRHVVNGETLATGESGSIVARLGADPAGERIELVDIDSRILDRKTVRVTAPVGEISATQTACGEPSTSADDDTESCTVRVAWACWKAPEASVWRVGIDPPAAPMLLAQGETESALDDQVPMNSSVIYEFRQKANYESGLLASTDTVYVRASQDSSD